MRAKLVAPNFEKKIRDLGQSKKKKRRKLYKCLI